MSSQTIGGLVIDSSISDLCCNELETHVFVQEFYGG